MFGSVIYTQVTDGGIIEKHERSDMEEVLREYKTIRRLGMNPIKIETNNRIFEKSWITTGVILRKALNETTSSATKTPPVRRKDDTKRRVDRKKRI